MTWLTWRQLRLQAAAVYVAAGAVAVVLAMTGPQLLDRARSHSNVFDAMTASDRRLFYLGIVLLALAPAVIGAFWGAPMVARELETGTHRLAWNQSVTRVRWLATRLGLTVATAAVAVGGLCLAVTWWSDPLDGAQSATRGGLPGRLTPVTFAMRGVVPVGYTVFAIVLGTAAGILLRRSLPAMATTLALVAAVQVAVPLWVRPHLAGPVTQVVTISRNRIDSISGDSRGRPTSIAATTGNHDDWVLSNDTVDAAGRVVGLPGWFVDCQTPQVEPVPLETGAGTRSQAPDLAACFDRLTAEGYRQRISYQPADRFWALQWRETGLFLALSALLAAGCLWWTRRLN